MRIVQRHPALFWGLGITILFLGLGLFRVEFIDTLEFKLYDVMINLRSSPESPSDIVLVDIDDDSIEKIGRWPWPRSLMAEGISKISAGKPKVIGFSLILSEPQESAGLKEIIGLENLFSKTLLNQCWDRMFTSVHLKFRLPPARNFWWVLKVRADHSSIILTLTFSTTKSPPASSETSWFC